MTYTIQKREAVKTGRRKWEDVWTIKTNLMLLGERAKAPGIIANEILNKQKAGTEVRVVKYKEVIWAGSVPTKVIRYK